MRHEYKAVPAPTRGEKSKGARSPEARFAHGFAEALNVEARDGWEYVGAETFSSEERRGLWGRKTVLCTLLIFRRAQDIEEGSATRAALRLLEDREERPGRPLSPRAER